MSPQNQNSMLPKANQNEAFTQKKQYLVAKKSGRSMVQHTQKPQTKETSPFAKELAKISAQSEEVKNIGDEQVLTENLQQEVVDPLLAVISETPTAEITLKLNQADDNGEELADIAGGFLPVDGENLPEENLQEPSVLNEIQKQIATMRSQLNDWEEKLKDLSQQEDDAELLDSTEQLQNNNDRLFSTETSIAGLSPSEQALDIELQAVVDDTPHTKPAFNKGELMQGGQNLRASSSSSQSFDEGNADSQGSFNENNKFLFAGLKQQAGQTETENAEVATTELTSSEKLNMTGLMSTANGMSDVATENFDLQLETSEVSVSNENKTSSLSQPAQPRGIDAKPTSVTINRPMGDLAWKQEFGEGIVWLADRAINKAEINVNPPHLGPISIQVDVKQDQASVVFNTQHAVVKEIIEAAIPKLKEMLAGQQIDLADFNVSQESSQQRSAQDLNDSGQQPSSSQTVSDQIDEQGADSADNLLTDTSLEQDGNEGMINSKVRTSQGLFDAHA